MTSRMLTIMPTRLRALCALSSVLSMLKDSAARVASATTWTPLSFTSHQFQFSIFHLLFSLFFSRHSSLATRHFFHPIEAHP